MSDVVFFEALARALSEARVASLQLAYQWMMARHPLEHGADCLALLNDSTIKSLETRLVDTQLFGYGKSRTIAFYSAEFDTTTPDGFNRMMRTCFGGSSGRHSLVLENPPPVMPAEWNPPALASVPALTAKQKTKRKVNCKAARKKNR